MTTRDNSGKDMSENMSKKELIKAIKARNYKIAQLEVEHICYKKAVQMMLPRLFPWMANRYTPNILLEKGDNSLLHIKCRHEALLKAWKDNNMEYFKDIDKWVRDEVDDENKRSIYVRCPYEPEEDFY